MLARLEPEECLASSIAMKIPADETTRVADLEELSVEPPDASRGRAYLLVLAGKNVGETHRIDNTPMVLGRSSSAEVVLLDDGVSRKHARIVPTGSDIVLEDLKSSNGTRVNGEAISRQTLCDGDTIRLGSTTILKFSFRDDLDEHFQQQMYEAALRDPLTKAYNRTFFLDRLETEVTHAKRNGGSLSLLLFDIDHFKQVNDTLGHVAGDMVLAELARVAQATVRSEDVFARYGGEEFGVLCRGIPLPVAGALGERLRAAVEACPFVEDGRRVAVTISVGVAAFPEVQADNGAALIGAADEALYQAKHSGRNRVVLKQ